MAVKQLFVVAVVVAVIFPIFASAMEYIVGDDLGWTVGFDYAAWAEGKEFHVGDTLVFKYQVGDHNVFKVNGTSFQDCIIPPSNEALTSGHDKIILSTPGRKWYICGVGMHCQYGGQKLAITVVDNAMAPAPGPYSASPKLDNAMAPAPAPYFAFRKLLS